MYAKYFYLLQNVEHFVISIRVHIYISPFEMLRFPNEEIELYLNI